MWVQPDFTGLPVAMLLTESSGSLCLGAPATSRPAEHYVTLDSPETIEEFLAL